MSRYHPIQPATLTWEDNTPHCSRHNDIYFSNEGGIEESQYVFLQGNDLPQRWQEKSTFTVAETGFGTGLNFLCTLAAWQNTTTHDQRLHYISAEKHPLTVNDLQRAIQQWPELKPLGDELIKNYPPLSFGFHQRSFMNNRVTLTLLFGDALEMISDLNAKVDAWYLDGFAPSKNPDLWTGKLFHHIARLTNPGGTFATFTAAGIVRRGLKENGFTVNTRPGFGRKREMLHGQLDKELHYKSPAPWFDYQISTSASKEAVVIGGGLAGTTVAHALAQRGWQITLIERHQQLAQEASGNHAGVVMPRLTADMSADGRFYLSAFLHTTHWLNQLKQRDPSLPWFQSGVLQLCNEKQQQRLAKLGLPKDILEICDQTTASKYCGITTQQGGLFYPGGGWLQPSALCHWLINDQNKNITTLFEQSALMLKRGNGQWQVIGNGGIIAKAETVIIANGYDAERLLGTDALKLQKVRGQVAHLQATHATQKLNTPICYEGYIIPVYQGLHCAGATYDIKDESSELKENDQTEILTALTQQLPDFANPDINGGRVAFRTSSQDHLPLIGPVPDFDFYREHYADLHHGKPAHRYPAAEYLPNLFISVGHGSRGLVSCPAAAHIIISTLSKTPMLLEKKIFNQIHSGRFFVRQLQHNY